MHVRFVQADDNLYTFLLCTHYSHTPRYKMAAAVFVVYVATVVSCLPYGGLTFASAAECKLYSSDPQVECLQGSKVTERVTNSERCWAVEFYSSWCGHCHNFAPAYKEAARSAAEWGNVLKVGAIDCSSSENMDTCREFGVMGYPTVKLFHAGDPNPKKSGEGFIGARSVDEVKMFFLDLVQSQPTPPPGWPTLDSLKFGDYLRLESENPRKPMVLAFDEDRSPLGRELIFKFLNDDRLIVRRVQKEPVLADHLSVGEYPAVVMQVGSNKNVVLRREEGKGNPLKWFSNAINEWLASQASQPSAHTQDRKSRRPPSTTVTSPTHTASTSVGKHSLVSVDDLFSAVGYAFHHEVPMHSIISGSAFSALLQFVMLLEQVFARLAPSAGESLRSLAKELHVAKADGFILQRDWVRLINPNNNPGLHVFPKDPVWHSCQGSKPEFRGYPCALWTLMHTLTIFTHPIVNQLPRSKPAHRTLPYGSQEALKISTDFVQNFFTCISCREHFTAMAANLEGHIKNDVDGVLWLWCAHNAVNLRLSGDTSEDPHFPKTQYPSPEQCPVCHWTATKGNKPGTRCHEFDLDSNKQKPLQWSENEVALHLCRVYGHSHISHDKCTLLGTAADVGRRPMVSPGERVKKEAAKGRHGSQDLTDSSSMQTGHGWQFGLLPAFAGGVLVFVLVKFRKRLPRLIHFSATHSHIL